MTNTKETPALKRAKDTLAFFHQGGGCDFPSGLMQELIDQLEETLHLLDLVSAEFRSDPTSVQCFDLNAIVNPINDLAKKWNDEGRP